MSKDINDKLPGTPFIKSVIALGAIFVLIRISLNMATHSYAVAIYKTGSLRIHSFFSAKTFPYIVIPSLFTLLIIGGMIFLFFRSRKHTWLVPTPFLLLIPMLWYPFFLEGMAFAAMAGLSIFLLIFFAHKNPPIVKEDISRRMARLLVFLFCLLLCWIIVHHQFQQFRYLRVGFDDYWIMFSRLRSVALGEAFLAAKYAPMFSDHFQPGMALWAPFYYIIPHVSMMFYIQGISISLVGVAVAIHAYNVLKRYDLAVFCAVIALLHPSITQMGYNFSYGFHPDYTALPFIVLSVMFWRNKRYWLFAFTGLLAISMHENLTTFYMAMGAVEFAYGVKSRKVIFPAVISCFSFAYFIIAVKFALTGGLMLGIFSHLGSSMSEVAIYLLTHPMYVLENIFSLRVVCYLCLLIGGLGFLPLLGARYLLYGSISFFGTVFMGYDHAMNICFQNQTGLLAACLIAFPIGLKNALAWLDRRKLPSTSFLGGLFVYAILLTCFYGLFPFSKYTLPYPLQGILKPQRIQYCQLVHDIAAVIPKDSHVVATDRAATVFLNFNLDSFSQFKWKTVPKKWPDFIILDSRDTGFTHSSKDLHRAIKFISQANLYQVLFIPAWMSRNIEIYIFKKKNTAAPRLDKYVFENAGRWLGM